LKLDCSKAITLLKWKPVWNINSTIEKTVRWYKAFYEKGDILTYQDLEDYINDAKNKDIEWTK
jgi:CDP-glucose 4,6-dehydratase